MKLMRYLGRERGIGLVLELPGGDLQITCERGRIKSSYLTTICALQVTFAALAVADRGRSTCALAEVKDFCLRSKILVSGACAGGQGGAECDVERYGILYTTRDSSRRGV